MTATLDREEVRRVLGLVIEAQEREAKATMEKARTEQLAGRKLSADTYNSRAAQHWCHKAGMIQAAEALGFTYLELFAYLPKKTHEAPAKR